MCILASQQEYLNKSISTSVGAPRQLSVSAVRLCYGSEALPCACPSAFIQAWAVGSRMLAFLLLASAHKALEEEGELSNYTLMLSETEFN